MRLNYATHPYALPLRAYVKFSMVFLRLHTKVSLNLHSINQPNPDSHQSVHDLAVVILFAVFNGARYVSAYNRSRATG